MIGNLKTVSARRIRQEYAAHLSKFSGKPGSGTTPTVWFLPEDMPTWRSYWITFKTRSGHRANTPLTHD
jgi:hypothetical protein